MLLICAEAHESAFRRGQQLVDVRGAGSSESRRRRPRGTSSARTEGPSMACRHGRFVLSAGADFNEGTYSSLVVWYRHEYAYASRGSVACRAGRAAAWRRQVVDDEEWTEILHRRLLRLG